MVDSENVNWNDEEKAQGLTLSGSNSIDYYHSEHVSSEADDATQLSSDFEKVEGSENKYKAAPKKWRPKKWQIMAYVGISIIRVLISLGQHFSSYENKADEDITDKYLGVLEKSNMASVWSERYTSEAHLAGTNKGLVDWQESMFKSFGLKNVKVDDYDIYLNYPLDNGLKMIDGKGKTVFKATLKEDELKEDPTTWGSDLVAAFHGYSANGNVTANFVYVNYGSKQDFDLLAEKGVDVKGKIAIARYGGLFRGMKVKFCQDAGAVGVLLYTDPADDKGTAENAEPYPKGPGRNPSSLQRGSVQFLSQIPGDPTTPGWPSKGDDIHRVNPHNSIPKIPSLPISFKEVAPILKALNGHGLKIKEWGGSIEGVEYNIGPNPDYKLNLHNEQDYKINKLYNVYGEIPGEVDDEVILVGNHRDAWIKGGAGDPNSGSAVTMEMVRALGELKEKYNWKPYRTIRFASWDGEEYGLLGSTEYGEYDHKFLQKNVVAYLNLDVGAVGRDLKIGASPLLYKALDTSLHKVIHPFDNVTLYEHFYKDGNHIMNLGSGSDYTVFLEHLGIPSSDMGFGPSKGGPVYHYHSNYDSFYWMSKYGDPGFIMHNTMAKYLGLVLMDLADTKVLKFGASDNSEVLQDFFGKTVEKIPKSWLNETVDVKKVFAKNRCHEPFQFENSWKDAEFAELAEILDSNGGYPSTDYEQYRQILKSDIVTLQDVISLTNSTILAFIGDSSVIEMRKAEAQNALDDLEKQGYSPWNPVYRYKLRKIMAQIKMVNIKLKLLERYFLSYQGLSNRKWFRHIVFASGRYTGYAGQVYPGLTEGIEDSDFQEVVKWLFIINGSFRKASKWLN